MSVIATFVKTFVTMTGLVTLALVAAVITITSMEPSTQDSVMNPIYHTIAYVQNVIDTKTITIKF